MGVKNYDEILQDLIRSHVLFHTSYDIASIDKWIPDIAMIAYYNDGFYREI